MKQKFWKIEGYDGAKRIFEKEVRFGYFSENQIRCLLKAMASKTGLELDEMIGAYASKNAKISNALLEVHRDQSNSTYSCGESPFFTARVVTHENF
jgi:hypothetical protein